MNATFRAGIAIAGLVAVVLHSPPLTPQAAGYNQLVAEAQADLKAGNTAQALTESQKAIAMVPSQWQAYVVAGGALQVEQQYDKAIDDFTKALEYAPEARKDAVRGLLEKCVKAQDAAQTTPAQTPAAQPASESTVTQAEVVLWKTIQNSTNPSDFQAYLRQYPNGAFAALAQNSLAKLQAAAATSQNTNKANSMLKEAQLDNQQGKYSEADQLMSQATEMMPDAALLWIELSRAQEGEKKLPAAATSLQKAIEVDAAAKVPKMDVEAAAQNRLGEVLVMMGKIAESQAAYESAVKDDPKNAAVYYGNEAIMMNRVGNIDATVAAANQAIAANPSNPIPYYLKGQALISGATIGKAGKIVAPPGCAEAYEKYLELAPNGPFAVQVKAILTSIQ